LLGLCPIYYKGINITTLAGAATCFRCRGVCCSCGARDFIYLRVRFAVLDEPQFIADLTSRYEAEMRLVRLAAATTIIGLSLILAGMVIFVITFEV
jgi:hypothetical protein